MFEQELEKTLRQLHGRPYTSEIPYLTGWAQALAWVVSEIKEREGKK